MSKNYINVINTIGFNGLNTYEITSNSWTITINKQETVFIDNKFNAIKIPLIKAINGRWRITGYDLVSKDGKIGFQEVIV